MIGNPEYRSIKVRSALILCAVISFALVFGSKITRPTCSYGYKPKPGSLAARYPSSYLARIRRDAQNVSSVFSAARAGEASGLDRVDSVESAMEAMISGVRGSGEFSASRFRVTLEEKASVASYLRWNHQKHQLEYLGGGGF
jgi:hypothetical protein